MADEISHEKLTILLKEVQELEVINAELESVKKPSNIYVKKDGGNLFFLPTNSSQTFSEYKRLLAVKRQQIKELESKIRKQQSSR